MQETWVGSLHWEDPLEKEMATHSSTLAWGIPWTEEPGRLQSTGRKESDTTEQLHLSHFDFDGFPNSHAWMWELDHKEGWVPKNWCFWTVMLEKTLESPLDCKENQPVHPGNQSWIFIGRTDAETWAPVLWPPDAKSWLIRKDPVAGKDWRQEEKGTTGDKMVS